jgi:hypothetical protein
MRYFVWQHYLEHANDRIDRLYGAYMNKEIAKQSAQQILNEHKEGFRVSDDRGSFSNLIITTDFALMILPENEMVGYEPESDREPELISPSHKDVTFRHLEWAFNLFQTYRFTGVNKL